MRKNSTSLLIIAAAIVLTLYSCKKNSTEPEPAYIDAVITHMGFDFSAGRSDTVDFNNNDGETISWMPGGGTNPQYPNGGSIWFRTSNNLSANETKDMGMVAMNSVTAVPAAWDTGAIAPLLPGHVIVAACKDGYVKFQVVSTDTTGFWPATVQYFYSTTNSFSQ